jgi:hypothetical protein
VLLLRGRRPRGFRGHREDDGPTHGGDSREVCGAWLLTLNTGSVHIEPMNPHVWELHARVFDLARARGLSKFRVNYSDAGGAIVIALVMAPANDTRRAGKLIPQHPR